MTGLASSLSATSDTIARAASAEAASTSSSKYFPWRTSLTPLWPIECSASTMVRPCGSNTDGFSVTNTLAFIKDSLEHFVDVSQLVVEIERFLDLGRGQHARDVAVGEQQPLEILLLVERAHRVALHPLIRLFARDAAARELQEHRAREHDAARALEVFAHPVGIHDHAGDDPRE